MPEIPKERLEGSKYQLLKPAKLGLGVGDRMEFTVMEGHKESKDGLYSLPVRTSTGISGNFPLNLTHTRMLADALQTRDTDKWVGAQFTAVVVRQNNPQTRQAVDSWSILKESITKKKGK